MISSIGNTETGAGPNDPHYRPIDHNTIWSIMNGNVDMLTQSSSKFLNRLCGSSRPPLISSFSFDFNQTIEFCRSLSTIYATPNVSIHSSKYGESLLYLPTSMVVSSSTNGTISNTVGSVSGPPEDEDSYLSPNLKITLIVLLSLMIACTVIGNILVCLSVILVRKLRHPSNYLLVSLAISDLCVAILVMPLALQYELSKSWRLSNAICDLWVSFDVTCCTSSILNLCTISIDRYLAITKPLTYGVRRTTKRILSFIVAVWVASCLISIPPVLILGNEHGSREQPRCEVSQNLGYQLYATLGAFYIPLLVMIVMYYKIYVAAKRVVDAELRDQKPTCSSSISLRTSRSSRFYSMRKTAGNTNNEQYPSIRLDKNQNCMDLSTPSEELKELNSKEKSTRKKRNKSKRKLRPKKDCCRQYCCCCCCCDGCGNGDGSNDQQSNEGTTPAASMMVNSSSDGMTTTSTVVTTTITTTGGQISSHKHLNGHQKLLTQTSQISNASSSSISNHFGFIIRKNRHRSFGGDSKPNNFVTMNTSALTSKQRASNALRERKASVTLGIIMTAFTVCWLPFFILAVLRPFSASVVQIPRYVNSIALWLGYANSMLNPIIYVTFHQDFRRAFKYLLCLQCRSMGTRLRAEAYLSQYGNKKSNPINQRNIHNAQISQSFDDSSRCAVHRTASSACVAAVTEEAATSTCGGTGSNYLDDIHADASASLSISHLGQLDLPAIMKMNVDERSHVTENSSSVKESKCVAAKIQESEQQAVVSGTIVTNTTTTTSARINGNSDCQVAPPT